MEAASWLHHGYSGRDGDIVPDRIRLFVPPVGHSRERNWPYRLLWIRVIMRAVNDYALGKNERNLKKRVLALEARKWLFETSDLSNSFDTICHAFDLPDHLFRELARVITPSQVRKFEHKERLGKDYLDAVEDSKLSSRQKKQVKKSDG